MHPETVNYTRIYSLSDVHDLQVDLHAHLTGPGRDQQLYLPRVNESPLRITVDCLDGETAAIIGDAYRVDIEAFPGRWQLGNLVLSDQPWTLDGVASVRTRQSGVPGRPAGSAETECEQ